MTPLCKSLRAQIQRLGMLRAAAAVKEDSVYRLYYDFTQPLSRLQSHQVLAINRGEKEGVLKVGVQTDDEQALALAMAAAQCAQRALESERFDTARHLAQRGLAWNNGSLYASAALMLHLWDILARCAQSAGPGQEEAAFADYRQAYAAQPVRARYHLAMARYQLERGKTAAAEAELRAVPMPPEESRAEYRVLQARLASASGRYAEAMTALRQAERTGPLPKLLERELLQAMELAARELQDYKTAYECAARQLKL